MADCKIIQKNLRNVFGLHLGQIIKIEGRLTENPKDLVKRKTV